jgi:tubulin-specific chaperone A
MKNRSVLKLKPKLVGLFLSVSLAFIPFASWWADYQSSKALKEDAFRQLEALRENKRAGVERHFQTLSSLLQTQTANPSVIQALENLRNRFLSIVPDNRLADADLASMRRSLQSFYNVEHANAFQRSNKGRAPEDTPNVQSMPSATLVLQHLYLANNPQPVGQKQQLVAASDPSRYSLLHAALHPMFRELAHKFNLADLALVDADSGVVLYSVAKNPDFGTSLVDGPYADSGLGKVFRRACKTRHEDPVSFIDFAPYSPALATPLAFLAAPIEVDGKTRGALVFSLPIQPISQIMAERAGQGQSGESYLVGPDQLPRSDCFLDPMNRSFEAAFKNPARGRLTSANVKAALDGESGAAEYNDYRGHKAFAAYGPVRVEDAQWAIVAKIDESEALAPARLMAWSLAGGGLLISLLLALIANAAANRIVHPLRKGVEFAEAITSGDYSATLDLPRRDEIGDLARALDDMADALRGQDWRNAGKAGLNDQLRGEQEINSLAKKCVSFIVKHLNAQLGAVYLAQGEVLTLVAGYAFSDRQGNFNKIKFGEGLVGQAALERETIAFQTSGEQAPTFNYGVGERPPAYFLIVPLVYEDELLGVAQIGSNSPFTPLTLRFVEENAENVAVALHSAQSRTRIQELLDYSREQADALQTQQDRLKAANKELEDQASALRESESSLQTQQEELRVANEELAERSKALEEQRDAMRRKNIELKRAQADIKGKAMELEQASRYKSEFLANMSHELRTPLNSILILSQILRENKEHNLNERQIEYASTIYSSGSDLLTLINDVLDLSRVESGKIELDVRDMDLAGFAQSVERVFSPIAANKSLEFLVTLDPELPASIKTDARRVQQIVHNLLTNACKFTEHGSVSLRIHRPEESFDFHHSGLKGESTVAFTVKDTGIGVPQEKQSQIFEAFRQADGTTSRRYGGTGLGLSISRDLATLLGGEIRLVSEENQGSEFSLYLPERIECEIDDQPAPLLAPARPAPAAPIKAPARQEPPLLADSGQINRLLAEASVMRKSSSGDVFSSHAHKPAPSPSPDSTAEKALLIIEDDPHFARILEELAHERGFGCTVARDGETGLVLAADMSPAAILLDVGLPGIDGMKVLSRLKADPKTRHIPIHVISAFDESIEAMRMGAIGYLTKPVSMEQLRRAFTKMEDLIARPVKRLLVVEDDDAQRAAVVELIGNGDVRTTAVATGEEAYELLTSQAFDCIILDLGLRDMSGFELLTMIRNNERISNVPVIVYTGRQLAPAEETELARLSESIIIKGVRSPERLLDETALFLHRVEADLPSDKRSMLRKVHDKETILKDKKILIVDDDRRNVFAISSVLEGRGLRVIAAANGRESLEALEEAPDIDLVLMDIMMPEMDGYEAIRAIRRDKRFGRLPIIALTAKAMLGDRVKCIEAGANDYLAKPVDPDKLLSLMRVWLYQ